MRTSGRICYVPLKEFLEHKETLIAETLKPNVIIMVEFTLDSIEEYGGVEKVAVLTGLSRSTIFRLKKRKNMTLHLNYHKKNKPS